MYCVECGTKNPDDAKFCKQCGRRMEALGPAGSAPAEAPPAEPTRPAQAPDPEARYKELLALGFRHYDHAEYDAAALAVMSALEVRPDSTDAHALLSTIYERLGDREKAIAERERVLQLNPASIADREKLEALRSGIAQVAPRKILSSHRPDPTFWDTPAGAAAAAGIVTVVVVVIGYAVTLYRDRAQGPAPLIQPGTAVTSAQGRPAVADPNPAMLSGSGGQQNQTPTQAGQNPQSAGPAPQTRLPEGQPTGMVEPLPVRPTPPALGQDTGTAG
ncbi:MAG: zinc-ribbon domain-containing protein, partial [Armatimonadetes bacterium]|nr:zinc-ribbon domain-containing protein [Armatimonadota bacterium]